CNVEVESIFHIFLNCPQSAVILSPIRYVLKTPISWRQLLLGNYIGILSCYWNLTRAEFLWVIWKLRNSYVFNVAHQAPSLKALFLDFNLHVFKVKLNESNIYYLRNWIIKDTEKAHKAMEAEDLELPNNKRKLVEIKNMLAANLEASRAALEAISKARSFMEKIQGMIDSLKD
ncbi:hypothetical protein GOP47_0011974, partial [Adiantum capillus-veneris]